MSKQEKIYHAKCPRGHANEYPLQEICAGGTTVYRSRTGNEKCADVNEDRLRLTCKKCGTQWVECVDCRGA